MSGVVESFGKKDVATAGYTKVSIIILPIDSGQH